jgi:5-methylcytosine-specific restriction endonuclease McrA
MSWATRSPRTSTSRPPVLGSHRDVKIPFAGAPPGTCKWCGQKILFGRRDRRWHDGRSAPQKILHKVREHGTPEQWHAIQRPERNCFGEYDLATNHDAVRARALKEGWHHCAVCGRPGPGLHGPADWAGGAWHAQRQSEYRAVMDALVDEINRQDRQRRMDADEEWWHAAPPIPHDTWHIYRKVNEYVRGVRGYTATHGRIRAEWEHTLEVDHIIPLADAAEMGLTGMEPWALPNLQLLCIVHHKEKTSHEATARAVRRRPPDPQLGLEIA